MKLQKRIPARTYVLEIKQFIENFNTMTQRWRELRPDMDMKCFWCKTDFKDGDNVSVAIPKKHKNILLCKNCVKEII